MFHSKILPITIDATCDCGGKMIPARNWMGRRIAAWRCSRSHWWNRKAHAYLVVKLSRDPGK